ncbi:hypothetical protein PTZ02_09435 [Clostridium sp. 'White wine YQ']|nr:hypothetical protein [Clostridium sp. 'White wine YQ']
MLIVIPTKTITKPTKLYINPSLDDIPQPTNAINATPTIEISIPNNINFIEFLFSVYLINIARVISIGISKSKNSIQISLFLIINS